MAAVTSVVMRTGQAQLTMLATQAPQVDLDADLEEQEHDAHVREQREVLPIGHEAGRDDTATPSAR